MTNEEAIELLCAYGVPLDEDKFREALDMAIKALKQIDGDLIPLITNAIKIAIERIKEMPSEEITKIMAEQSAGKTDGDLISRKDTIEWLKKVTVTDGITFETGFKQILTDIEQMTSAEKTAEWISHEEDDLAINDYQCSKCDYWTEYNTKYCPNCGCKMKGEEEE